jgi:phenylpropionate dioxygenase-like ring-hydroxylating dioxygenase large terminal subunit
LTTTQLPESLLRRRSDRGGKDPRRSTGRTDWGSWPAYEAAASGLREYWYPVVWSSQVSRKPIGVRVCDEKVVLMRDQHGRAWGLQDRCPHRGVPLSMGKEEFPGTITCAYHAWTYRLSDGELVAIITDGPDSPMCGKVAVTSYPVDEALGLVWVYVGDEAPHPLTRQLPEELVGAPPLAVGGRIEDRDGNWRYYAENGFDEGHAKYLHRTSYWRLFKTMPTWNKVHIERHGRWIYRIEDERHWDADFGELGPWTNRRWWKIKPKVQQGKSLGNTGMTQRPDAYIAAQDFPAFASLGMPGILRIAYPRFIHYEFYVPIDAEHTKYVGFMVKFGDAKARLSFYARYLGAIRWLFHGNFSGQDHWMVSHTDAPPERLYRPDVSLLEWRRLVEEGHPFRPREPAVVAQDEPAAPESAHR